MEIQDRPNYPPEPVGVSITKPGKKPVYYAWGHVTGGNNCSKAQAVKALKEVWSGALLFFNAKFDVEVACVKLGLPEPDWDNLHDAMFLLYLHDPHARDLKLKPASERLLNMPPEERDVVKEWLWDNRKMLKSEYGITFSKADSGKNTWARFIAYAPGDVVGPYANSDCDRTIKLFRYLYEDIASRGMLPAYDRERQCLPIFLRNEQEGMRVNLHQLEHDVEMYEKALARVDQWLNKYFKSNISWDNDNDIVEVFLKNNAIPPEEWSFTATGKHSLKKDLLRPHQYNDWKVASAFGYRNRLSTCLKMFMQPWLVRASLSGGMISTNWNQVRQPGGGTRTGRPSTSNPNFLNVSKSWHDKDDGYVHPTFIRNLPELPLVRKYVLPDKGDTFGHRDFNGQELRILGHFEDGELLEAYRANPRMDVHEHVRQLILVFGINYHRTQVKVTNFRRIYGGGAPATAGALGISIEEAKKLLAEHSKALPGLKALNDDIKTISNRGEPIVTWGGREYYVEPPGYDAKYKRHMTYEYKLLNYLIQGSAADATKQALINYDRHPKRRGRFLVTVYDEINSSMPSSKAGLKHEMEVLRDCMECLDFDVPLLSDAKVGPSWGELVKYLEPASKYERVQ